MSLGIKSPSMKAPAQSSAPQNTSVGSGSRPTRSKMSTPTSAPDGAYKLDGRGAVKGYLGSGQEKG